MSLSWGRLSTRRVRQAPKAYSRPLYSSCINSIDRKKNVVNLEKMHD
jgi:hypothetical protein